MLRNPVWLFVGLSTPLLYLVLFTPLLNHLPLGGSGHGRAIDDFLPGILSLQAFARGNGPGFGTIFELKSGFTERLRVTPASRLALLLGPVLFAIAAMFVFDILLVAVGAAFGFQVDLAGLGVLAVLLGLCSFASVVTGLNLPVLLLGGVLLPISFGPTWLRVLAHFNPLYYLVVASRELSGGRWPPPPRGRPLPCSSPSACSLWPGPPASSGGRWHDHYT